MRKKIDYQRAGPVLKQYCFIILASPSFDKAARINKAKSDHVKKTPVGHETTLKCFYEGQPPPEVFWTKEKVKLGDKCELCVQKVEQQHGVSTLRVTPFRDADFGDYKCKARNKLGFQHIMIKLLEDKSKSKLSGFFCFRLFTISFPLVSTWRSSFNLLTVVHSFGLSILRVLCAIWKLFFSALHFSNLTNFFPTSPPLDVTQCQQDRILSRDPRLKLEFLPRCNADGSYHKIQCSVHLNKCWCVDQSGHKVADAVHDDIGRHCASSPKGKELSIPFFSVLICISQIEASTSPPGIPRAFDVFSCPGGGNFINLIFPGAGI